MPVSLAFVNVFSCKMPRFFTPLLVLTAGEPR
jgi:hypothetical protein